MRIDAHRTGKTYRPLDDLVVRDVPGAQLELLDGRGTRVAEAPAAAAVHLTLGGAPGRLQLRALDDQGNVIEEIPLRLEPETHLREDTGNYQDLFRMLELTLKNDGNAQTVTYRGKLYTYLVCWLRDHVHTLKGSKYWVSDIKSGIEIYRDSQREDGMIWDNIYPRTPEPNYWDYRFKEGDFIRPFEDFSHEFKRIPVENDVEYLYVEGIYVTWKATADDAWMAEHLDSAIRALEYSVSDPYRWSDKYQLLKRGYTIDTWDFQNDYDRIIEGDIMRVRVGETRFGVMFGDNTGYAMACRQLAEMLEHVGRGQEAPTYRERADQILDRLNALTWQGTHYLHHLREDPSFQPDFGVDTDAQISLSNTYSMNREIGLDKNRAILGRYQEIRDNLPEGAPGEWYMIYPPFERGFDGDAGKWHYMNGGVSAICAGEMARAAFFSGEEGYGADILVRLRELGARYRDTFQEAYQGAIPPPPPTQFTPVDLRDLANCDPAAGHGSATAWSDDPANDLSRLAAGRQVYEEIPFVLIDPSENGRRALVAVGNRPGFPSTQKIPVSCKLGSLYFHHTCSGASSVAGVLRLHYTDGGSWSTYVMLGKHVLGWWLPEPPVQHGVRNLGIGWTGENPRCPYLGLTVWAVNNPHPDREVATIELEGAEGGAVWGVSALTLSDQAAYLRPNGLSYGIPRGWGAAAVVYAMAEGLAGVVDAATGFESVRWCPRWTATSAREAVVCFHYPASGGYVAYRYRRVGEILEFVVTGSGDRIDAEILLPAGAILRAASLNDAPLAVTLQRVADSNYVQFPLRGRGLHRVRLELEEA